MRPAFRTIVSTGLTMALLGFLATGCLDEGVSVLPDSATATLSVDVETLDNKTIWPNEWAASIGTYRIDVLDAAGGEAASWGPDVVSGAVTFAGLSYGTYDVVVYGYCGDTASTSCVLLETNPAPSLIAAGRTDGVAIDAATVDVTVTAAPLFGVDYAATTGWMDITLEWPVDQLVTEVQMERKLVGDTNWSATEYFAIGTGESSVQVLDGTADVANGSHLLRFRLYDADNTLISTAIEVVNVYGNYRTFGVITLTADDFTVIEPDWAEYVQGMSAGELLFVVRNWEPATIPATLYIPGTHVDWDTTDPAIVMEWFPIYTTLFFSSAFAIQPFEFKVCNSLGTEWDCWEWPDWTLEGVPSQFTPNRLADIEQLRVPVGESDAAVIVFDVATETITVYAKPALGDLNVTIETGDPAPVSDITLSCALEGDNLVCDHDGSFTGGQTYKWYLNGLALNDRTEATLSYPAAELAPGDRITLVVTDTPFAYSAMVTLTAAMLGL